jgi:hypothetical protein
MLLTDLSFSEIDINHSLTQKQEKKKKKKKKKKEEEEEEEEERCISTHTKCQFLSSTTYFF